MFLGETNPLTTITSVIAPVKALWKWTLPREIMLQSAISHTISISCDRERERSLQQKTTLNFNIISQNKGIKSAVVALILSVFSITNE